jgi:hypothetical protein
MTHPVLRDYSALVRVLPEELAAALASGKQLDEP